MLYEYIDVKFRPLDDDKYELIYDGKTYICYQGKIETPLMINDKVVSVKVRYEYAPCDEVDANKVTHWFTCNENHEEWFLQIIERKK